ncbi:MAG: hypothetical protein L6Q71_09635 [Planctomycetes bacterium]|nr:hypothetical protein [Planctomycetota bacterium]
MIYPVRVKHFAANGPVRFELRGQELAAAHDIDAAEAGELLEAGAVYPLSLCLKATNVEYAAKPEKAFDQIMGGTSGDTVRLTGRVADYLAHDAVRLDGPISLAVKLTAPQSSTDFRRGSWLVAEGALFASLAEPDH